MAMTKSKIGMRARTGEICPESGVWQVEGSPSTTAPSLRATECRLTTAKQ